jgi:hypothetical protein
MKRVILESPYKARTFIGRWLNRRYAQRCMRDSIMRGEAPFASHLLYTQSYILRDSDPVERQLGIDCGLAWGEYADIVVVYVDRGVSSGMLMGIDAAKRAGCLIEYRHLGKRAAVEN